MRLAAWLLALAAARGQAEGNPEQVLERARAKFQAMAHDLSRYACIETVERQYFQPVLDTKAEALAEAPAASCDAVKANPHQPQKLESTDRLRLEVTVSEGREIYSWPGATRFDSRDVDEIIREGPIGTGSFGTHLLGIFDNPGVQFRFAGRQTVEQREILEYSFHVGLEASRYRVKAGAAWRAIAYSGSFWLDAQSLELRRLTVRADEVPRETSICELNAALDYGRVHIGDGEALLPRQGQLQISLASGRQTNNLTTFADCREYQAESAVSFEEGGDVKSAPSRTTVRAPLAIPLGLPVTLALAAGIDTDSAAAGDPVSAKVVKAVRRPGTDEVLIPAGATVRGRVTRVEHHILPTPYFLVAISFNRLVIQDTTAPFAARSERKPELEKELGANRLVQGRGLGFWGVGTFLFPTAKSHYVMPAGYETKWITLAIRGR